MRDGKGGLWMLWGFGGTWDATAWVLGAGIVCVGVWVYAFGEWSIVLGMVEMWRICRSWH